MKYSDSLKKKPDFDLVYRKGHSKATHNLVLYVRPNDSNLNRLGISVSKKVGNSVVRHHITRLIREAYRLHEEEFKRGIDLVIVVRPAAKEITYHETERDLMHLSDILKVRV